MPIQGSFALEPFAAHAAHVRPLLRVRLLVHQKVRSVEEALAAVLAFEQLLAGVGPLVVVQERVALKR